MLRIAAAISLFVPLAIAAAPTPAAAQAVCSERSTFVRGLAAQHRESPVALGIIADGKVLEVLASKDGTWTILVTSPNGRSCVLAVGESWEELKLKSAGPTA